MEAKQLNIIHADDDLDDCFFFKKALEGLSMPTHLTSVHDGEQLMQLLVDEETKLPDVIFLDINMPRKNGFECLNEIKRNGKLKNIPVVMLSTSKSNDSISMVFKNGGHVYVHKPRDFEQLVQVIHHALPMVVTKQFPDSNLNYILNA